MNDRARTSLLPEPIDLPDWFSPLLVALNNDHTESLLRFAKPDDVVARESSVLVLFGQAATGGPDVLIIERASDMRSHAGQPAFPGGADEPGDATPIATALREAQEETGLDPQGVAVVATLPLMWLPPSGFVVTPVLAWWRDPSPVYAADPREVQSVHRIAIAELVNPLNRVRVSHPAGYIGPGFEVNGLLIWGFTAMLLDGIFRLAGWNQEWESEARTVPFDDGWRAVSAGG